MAKFDKIPPALKELDQWVCWRFEPDEKKPGRMKKVPMNPRDGSRARSNDPTTWSNFAAALTAQKVYSFDGIGIMFANGIFGVDIDHCIDLESGEIQPEASEIIAAVRSYTELSPSRTGIHILCRGSLPDGRRRKGNVEMYSSGRFFTVTGEIFGEEYPFDDCTERIKAMHEKYLAEQPMDAPQMPAPMPQKSSQEGFSMAPDDVMARIRKSRQGQKFEDFMAGRWETMNIGDGSQSCADQAFCNLLAFWCRCDEGLMDTIFRRSGMMRKKWDTRRGGSTYGANTIKRSIQDCREVWEPQKKERRKEAPAPPPAPPKEENQTPPVPPEESAPQQEKRYYLLDDTGNAQRFRDRFKEDVRFNHVDKTWLYWDGRRWKEDETGEIKRKADEMLSEMEQQLRTDGDLFDPNAFRKHLSRSRSHRGKEAFLAEAQHLEGIPVLPSDLDRPPNAFNAKNCMISLKTGASSEHQRKWMITRLSPARYDPKAACPRWLSFLEDITLGDKELQHYLQVMVGYCLTAETREQCMFILYGNGANGKSTFVDTLAKLMGDYATTCNPETVMLRNRNSGIRSDIARLRGIRMVTTTETEDGERLDESVVKQMTSGTENEIVARFLYGREFTFVPEFKIVMSTNHKPKITGTDNGIWRRIRLIPFNAHFDKGKKDDKMPEKLRKEFSGILGWAVQGAVDWHQNGFPRCQVVDGASAEYRSEMDRLQQFEEDCVVRREGASIQASVLYSCYKAWCAEQGDRFPVSSVKFYGEFKKRCESRKTSAYNEYLGIAFSDHGLALSHVGSGVPAI